MCRWSMRLCALRREFAANWKCHGNGKQSPRRGAAPVAWNAIETGSLQNYVAKLKAGERRATTPLKSGARA